MTNKKIEDILLHDQTIFKDIEVFNPDYMPENFTMREGQMQEMAYSIRPILRGGKPINNIILGPPASGKTTAVKKLFEILEDHSNQVVCVHINCQLHSTKFDIFSQIYYAVFGYKPPETGIPFARIYNSIMNELVRNKRSLIVALDDINHLFTKNMISEIFYDILRAYESYPGLRTGIFAILSDVKFQYVLDKNVGSIFNAGEIHFNPYTYKQIEHILKERVNLGFYPGVINDEQIDMIVDQTFSMGDLRLGIDLLRMSGNNAEIRASRKIDDEDVLKAIKSSDKLTLNYTIESMSDREKDILRFINNLDEEQITSGELYERYNRKFKLSYATFNRLINKLEFMRILDTKYTGAGKKGKSRYITLRFDHDQIEESIQ